MFFFVVVTCYHKNSYLNILLDNYTYNVRSKQLYQQLILFILYFFVTYYYYIIEYFVIKENYIITN